MLAGTVGSHAPDPRRFQHFQVTLRRMMGAVYDWSAEIQGLTTAVLLVFAKRASLAATPPPGLVVRSSAGFAKMVIGRRDRDPS